MRNCGDKTLFALPYFASIDAIQFSHIFLGSSLLFDHSVGTILDNDYILRILHDDFFFSRYLSSSDQPYNVWIFIQVKVQRANRIKIYYNYSFKCVRSRKSLYFVFVNKWNITINRIEKYSFRTVFVRPIFTYCDLHMYIGV